jgi:host factor-I protein
MSLETKYLEKLQKENNPVAIYLINGIKLSGLISGLDNSTVLLTDSKSTVDQLIYKHAISTVVPTKI